jgi:outer membrane cobalamin receptor
VSTATLEVFPTSRLSVGFTWQRMGRRYLTRANTKWIEAYLVFDLDVRRSFHEAIELLVSVKNLGGDSYYDIDDFPVPGRTVLVALDLSFFGGGS